MRYPRPVSEIDTFRAAELLIEYYGEEASFIAAERADAFLARGDIAGQRTWLAVYRTVAELVRTTRLPTDPQN